MITTHAPDTLNSVDGKRTGHDDSLVEIRPFADPVDQVVTIRLAGHSFPGGEELDLRPGSAARLVGLLVAALDQLDPAMAQTARTLVG